ncbi:MAG: hypothetical protein GY847_33660 [Proteobacteria bacterium]|nr:hypothetical protein [Pseudomonadota bacterium]
MFASKLENALNSVNGGEAAILMGFDGIPLESFGLNEQLDIETVGMEFSVVLKDVRKASELLEAGSTEELTIRTDRLTTIIRVIDKNYFIAMAIATEGNLGKARYILRVLASSLREDLV